MEDKKQIPIVDGLFTWPAEKPQLIGGRCKLCGRYFFPKTSPVHKPGCPGDVETVKLSRNGKLVSYTWQYYQPPPPFRAPEPFVPFGLGLVELPEGIRVFGIMTAKDQSELKMGIDVEMIIDELYKDEQGTGHLTWKFRPAQK
ncbi:Zn-ribbon domain-containing OB-fold protein [Chloroflexota bacterium]